MAIPKGTMGYDQYTFPGTVDVKPTFLAFLQHSQLYSHGLSCHSFKFLWKTVNRKSAHNTFRACRVHFFRQPFSKKLYIQSRLVFLSRCEIHARSTRYANIDNIINLRYARRGINCGRQEKPAILISRLLLRMRRMYVASMFGLPLRVNRMRRTRVLTICHVTRHSVWAKSFWPSIVVARTPFNFGYYYYVLYVRD